MCCRGSRGLGHVADEGAPVDDADAELEADFDLAVGEGCAGAGVVGDEQFGRVAAVDKADLEAVAVGGVPDEPVFGGAGVPVRDDVGEPTVEEGVAGGETSPVAAAAL